MKILPLPGFPLSKFVFDKNGELLSSVLIKLNNECYFSFLLDYNGIFFFFYYFQSYFLYFDSVILLFGPITSHALLAPISVVICYTNTAGGRVQYFRLTSHLLTQKICAIFTHTSVRTETYVPIVRFSLLRLSSKTKPLHIKDSSAVLITFIDSPNFLFYDCQL